MTPETAPVDLTMFTVISAVICASALLCALSKNIVRSAFALLGAFGGVAGLYAFLSADFVMAVQLLVYVGGILVLILFAVLLTQKIGEVHITNRSVGLYAGLPLAGLVFAVLASVAVTTPWPRATSSAVQATTGLIGDALLSRYLLPFELVSVLLLVALVGAVILARREVRRSEQDEPAPQDAGGKA